MGLSFPSDISTSRDVFLMYPTAFSVQPRDGTVIVNKTLGTGFSIALPTPSGGISLTESGDWGETAGKSDAAGAAKHIAVKAGADSIGAFGQVAAGNIFANDYASLAYNGSGFRTFTFQWDLIPSSEKEAIAISDIIKRIRTESLPSYAGSILNYPSMWKVYPAMYSKVDLYLQDCVISSFTVNYTPDGVLRQYTSGHPIAVNMEIEFKELYRAGREDI